jgi:hypothetical protein
MRTHESEDRRHGTGFPPADGNPLAAASRTRGRLAPLAA